MELDGLHNCSIKHTQLTYQTYIYIHTCYSTHLNFAMKLTIMYNVTICYCIM